MTNKIIFLCFILSGFYSLAQNEDAKIVTETEDVLVVSDSTAFIKKEYDALSPSKAAFYSAVLPGLGQAYNKKYWKIPIVYAAIGTGIYFYVTNNNQYNDVRDAYKRRLAGFQDDEFQGQLTDDGLLEAQKTLRRNKELSLLITFGLYALNIIDANVDAHLMQFNVNDDLSFKPHYKIEEFDNKGRFGLTLNYQF
ncbi:DUF5683 domain-containing protein [Aurantibacter aestuarii]|uniref:DUF5683 domain-containing protein n=1 Tax=Aurantibacter aestuarii TaxID=1266046 RepID=A0A2T1N554_9FLAO|nr:DUF5683 domain-containing protein [Aurantibacter aestuarii]PSG86403.1 hypothetical protein C7H52_11980 [Aurantibacter aestuarii]